MRGLPIDPTDILALVLMAIFSVRRSDAKATDPRAFPSVAPGAFEEWRIRAVFAKSVLANSSFAKAAFNMLWFFGFRNRVPPHVLAAGGALLFFAWTVAMVVGLVLGFRASRMAERLGIVEGRRMVEVAPAKGPDASG